MKKNHTNQIKNNFKKTALLFLFFLMFSYVSNAQYTLTASDVEIEGSVIIKYINTTEKNIIIPDSIGGQRVTEIALLGFFAFDLESVVLPKFLKEIGKSAFANNELTEINFPDALEKIGPEAFDQNKLKSINLSGTKSIGNYAFGRNNIETISIALTNPSGLGNGVFNNNNLKFINGNPTPDGIVYKYKTDGTFDTSIISSYGGNATVLDFIPSFVTRLAPLAFGKCFSIKKAVIPSNVTAIEDFAFERVDILDLTIEEGLKTIGAQAFNGANPGILNLPNSLIQIGDRAFLNNICTEINFGNSLVSIDASAFEGHQISTGSKIKLPNSLMKIGKKAFSAPSFDFIILPEVIKTGFTFLEWTDDSGNVYPSNTKVNPTISTYTAKLEPSFFLDVTFVDHDNSVLKSESVTYDAEATAPGIPNTKPGFIFDKWDINFNNVIENITVKAIYRVALPFTVTFLDLDGNILLESTQLESEPITFPDPIFGDDFVFLNWTDVLVGFESTYTSTPNILESFPVGDDANLVYFLDDFGVIISTVLVNLNEGAIAPVAPVKRDKEFVGWDKDFSNVTENLIVRAIYESTLLSTSDFVNEKQKLLAYPNPISSNELLTLKTNNINAISAIKILTLTGQIVYYKKANTFNDGAFKIPVNHPSGVYLIQIITENNNTITKKIIIKQ